MLPDQRGGDARANRYECVHVISGSIDAAPTRNARNDTACNSAGEIAMPSRAARPTGASIARAAVQSSGRGNRAIVQPRNR
jgi:hypothetical protein